MSWLSRLVWIIEILLFLFFYQIFLNFIIKTWSNFNINFPENIFQNFHYTKHFRYHPHTYIKKCENTKKQPHTHPYTQKAKVSNDRRAEKRKSVNPADATLSLSHRQVKQKFDRELCFFSGFPPRFSGRDFPAAIFSFGHSVRIFSPRVFHFRRVPPIYFFFRCFFFARSESIQLDVFQCRRFWVGRVERSPQHKN